MATGRYTPFLHPTVEGLDLAPRQTLQHAAHSTPPPSAQVPEPLPPNPSAGMAPVFYNDNGQFPEPLPPNPAAGLGAVYYNENGQASPSSCCPTLSTLRATRSLLMSFAPLGVDRLLSSHAGSAVQTCSQVMLGLWYKRCAVSAALLQMLRAVTGIRAPSKDPPPTPPS